MKKASQHTRKEHDFIGELQIPDENYFGIQTYRAMQNFDITGIKLYKEPDFIKALAYVKKAAAKANEKCGVLSSKIADAIGYACDELLTGEYDNQFVTDMIQGGAGTSINMNANEVIANLALEHLGHKKGAYKKIHPNNHVNCSQSTNDTYQTAFKIALFLKIENFLEKLKKLSKAFQQKGEEFKDILKMGRTQMQDAVPMSLGDEFYAYSTGMEEEIKAIREIRKLMLEINMGATAIGTGVNAPKGYAELCLKYLSEETGLKLTLAPDLIEATNDTGDFVHVMGTLKRSAVKISKICNDLRLLSSGPRTGFNEINLPAYQPGSSIMPGKVNPVIPEVVNQVCFYVVGQDTTVTMASEAGQLQLNVMEPVIAFGLFTSFDYMTNAIETLTERCIKGITANIKRNETNVMNSVSIVTQLTPLLGYEKCAEIAKEALEKEKTIHQIVVEEQEIISQEKWDEIYSFENLIRPKFMGKE